MAELQAAIDSGQPIDWSVVAARQAIDLVRLGREFVNERVKADEELDGRLLEDFATGRVSRPAN